MDPQAFLNTDSFDFSAPMDLPSPPASEHDVFICPQDVTIQSQRDTASPTPQSDGDSPSQDTNSTPDSYSQGKKKRKSWGQVLPEPTTNLPPRKRAKTEAEKEQRKYERVQRNRQAAHNSRMRKQLEMDSLATKNEELANKNKLLQAHIARLEHQLRLATGQESQLPPSPSDTSAWSAPSLCDAASPSDTSISLDQAPTPCEIKFEPDFASEIKRFDDSHSAEMCSQQWTSNLTSEQSRPISLVDV